MAKFRRIECSIWENDDFLVLPAGSKTQFLYACTNSARTESGLYRMSKTTMFWRTKTNGSHFKKLSNSSLIDWDDKKEIMWIVSALDPKYFRPNPKIWISVENDLKLFWPHEFVEKICTKYGIYKEITKAFQSLSKGSESL